MKQKTILITGASSGMGFEAARLLAQQGHRVFGAARRTELMEPLRQYGVIPIHMDITDNESIAAAMATIAAATDRIDVLLNNAGYGSFGAVEDVPLDEARRQFEVNVFGLAAMTQHVLPYMRHHKSGLIINIGSVAGRMPFQFGTWYNATKYSVRAISDAMRMEVRSHGIRVVLIEPGPIATAWGGIAADHLCQSATGGAYEQQALRAADGLRHLYAMRWLTKPETVAKKIVHIIGISHPRRRYPMGRGARAMIAMSRLLPPALYDSIAISAMGKM